MLTVSLVNARFFAFHGWHQEEQKCGNWFEVDVDVTLPADNGEQLDGTIDYAVIFQLVKERMSVPTQLLETLTKYILKDILAIEADAKISVVIRKENPPMGGQVQYSQVKRTNF